MSSPMVSVIVPTYNRIQMLRRALESVARQTFEDYEVIVVNDGGEDVRDVVDMSKVRLISLAKNQGLPAARNTGLEAARGKYIAYLDDDDEYLAGHLETLVGMLEGSKYEAAYSDCWFQYPYGRRVREMSFDYDREAMRHKNLTPCICVMHERSILDEVGYFDVRLENHEDWDMWIRMGEFYDFLHIPEVTAVYHKHSGGMSADLETHRAGYWKIRVRYGTAYYAKEEEGDCFVPRNDREDCFVPRNDRRGARNDRDGARNDREAVG